MTSRIGPEWFSNIVWFLEVEVVHRIVLLYEAMVTWVRNAWVGACEP